MLQGAKEGAKVEAAATKLEEAAKAKGEALASEMEAAEAKRQAALDLTAAKGASESIKARDDAGLSNPETS